MREKFEKHFIQTLTAGFEIAYEKGRQDGNRENIPMRSKPDQVVKPLIP